MPVSWAEIDAFIRVAVLSKRCQWAWKLAVLMRYTGMRCNEARLVRWDHVQDNWIHLPADLCKTRRGRKIPIAGDLLAFPTEWRDHSGSLVPDLPDGARYKRSTVIQAFSRLWEKAHLEERVPREAFGHIPGRANSSPTHTFRNCFSSQLKRAGARWEAVEAVLGHYSSIGVASHYDFLDDLMLEAVELVPPLNSEVQTVIALTAAK
ncbi:MAG: hypothetical protein CMP23_16655 [Rickettsiales bacterium]|nr:hypothetical protein [Rickettsiales bacterium]